MNTAVVVIARVLETAFVIGGIGCVITIPLVAWKMFSVLVEGDDESDEA